MKCGVSVGKIEFVKKMRSFPSAFFNGQLTMDNFGREETFYSEEFFLPDCITNGFILISVQKFVGANGKLLQKNINTIGNKRVLKYIFSARHQLQTPHSKLHIK